MNKFLVIFTICFSLNLVAQSSVRIKGVVKVENASAEGIHVLNLVSEKATITDVNGGFFLEVKEDDLLVFSAVHLNYWRKSITANEIKAAYIEIEMTAKENQLDEVVVTENVSVTAQSLGIITYVPKTYTPAERRIRTATTGFLDPLLNWMSGRTKDLKKQLEVEKRERFIIRLESYFNDGFFIETLKIPEIYVSGFKYYVVEDEGLAQALNEKNKDRTRFLLGELTQEFLNYLKDYETVDQK